MSLDFHTADNAELPHVLVFEHGTNLAMFFIVPEMGMTIERAERAAQDFIDLWMTQGAEST